MGNHHFTIRANMSQHMEFFHSLTFLDFMDFGGKILAKHSVRSIGESTTTYGKYWIGHVDSKTIRKTNGRNLCAPSDYNYFYLILLQKGTHLILRYPLFKKSSRTSRLFSFGEFSVPLSFLRRFRDSRGTQLSGFL